jgi:GDPmannose 4,6-dehydratase
MSKRALITGITGMDGSHLAEFLLSKNYEVYGLERWKSHSDYQNISHLLDRITLLKGDLTDQNSIVRCLNVCKPNEVYNLAAQSFVGDSWTMPELTSDITGLGVLRILEAIRETDKDIRFYQASSSEIFGRTKGITDENALINPISPYGVAKAYGHMITKTYREGHNLYAVSGLLFNHESERRGLQFVTRKITNGVAKIKLGLENSISLGNIESKRDWGYAPDFVSGMWQMLQQEKPSDFVLASGEAKSIKEFLQVAFSCVGIEDWEKYIVVDQRYFRPTDNNFLWGNYTKAYNAFGWTPKTPFETWVKKMVDHDLRLLSN